MTRILSLIGVVLVVGCGPPPELLESYYDNGQLMVRGIYRDGVPEGLNETYHENGVVVQKGTYKDGEKCGEWLEGSRSVSLTLTTPKRLRRSPTTPVEESEGGVR